ncbi:NmrA family NAD(P)-binding protein [Xanthomonas sp. NCPPB 1128]|uniref:NmrA family NAD(P)-binding protein n=1 Tax=Xanthomonas sp. NCPPB 1128 TaxID=1775876 RepID=UPI000AF4E39A|nr:NmrA family NAD(P)-binding protein [Xanthomonas sp. NCPPB 1128]
MSPIPLSGPLLVSLGNGVQGGAVVRAARRHGLAVRALVRVGAPTAALHALGAEVVETDLDDATAVHAASRGVAHAVLQFPAGPGETTLARARLALEAARAARLHSLVLKLSSAPLPAPCPEPSLRSNAALAALALARGAGLPCAVLWPTLYLDNLLKPSARTEIVAHGVFAPPIAATQRIAWTSADACAEAALALLRHGAHGGSYRIAGTESLTGAELVQRLSAGLGRPVCYRAQSLDAFEREVDAALGAGHGRVVASKFRFFAEYPQQADALLAEPLQAQPGLEDFQPGSIDDWIVAHRQAFLASSFAPSGPPAD